MFVQLNMDIQFSLCLIQLCNIAGQKQELWPLEETSWRLIFSGQSRRWGTLQFSQSFGVKNVQVNTDFYSYFEVSWWLQFGMMMLKLRIWLSLTFCVRALQSNNMIFAKVLKAQADLGLDVVTDGEMERGAYYMQVKSLYAGPIEQSKYHTSYMLYARPTEQCKYCK